MFATSGHSLTFFQTQRYFYEKCLPLLHFSKRGKFVVKKLKKDLQGTGHFFSPVSLISFLCLDILIFTYTINFFYIRVLYKNFISFYPFF
jgi:hypothetical protein